MNAVIRKQDSADDFHVAVGGEIPMEEGLGELRADVRLIRVETADIKADLRATNVRIDDLLKEMKEDRKETAAQFAEIRKETAAQFAEIRNETAAQFAESRKETALLTARIGAVESRVENFETKTAANFERVDAGQKELVEKIDSVRDSLSQAKIWALGLYIGLAGALLLVMAHGFKWL